MSKYIEESNDSKKDDIYYMITINCRYKKRILKILKDITGKKEVILTSQLRTGFILTLQYLKKNIQIKMK